MSAAKFSTAAHVFFAGFVEKQVMHGEGPIFSSS
jgi:hypothetical protein